MLNSDVSGHWLLWQVSILGNQPHPGCAQKMQLLLKLTDT